MEVGFSRNHMCVRVKFELCDDSVGKKATNASDNKTSVFSTPSILCHKAVAGPSGLKKQVTQCDYSQLFSTPSILCQKQIL